MSILQNIQGNPAVKAGIAAVVLVLAAGAFYFNLRTPPETVDRLWYFDLNTQQLFAAADQVPPIAAPSGPIDGKPAGVRAYVYACGTCDPATNKTGWLETFPPEAGIAGSYASLGYDFPLGASTLIKRPNDKEWVKADSSEAREIKEEAKSRCAETAAFTLCGPK